MSKHLPKTSKALSNEYRKRIVEEIGNNLKNVWNDCKFSEEHVKKDKCFKSLNEYITQLEAKVYNRKYVLGSIDDYRLKIKTLQYNLQHNGLYLFTKYTPSELTILSATELGKNADLTNIQNISNSKNVMSYSPIVVIVDVEPNEKGKKVKVRDAYEISSTLEDIETNILPKVLGIGKLKSMMSCNKCGPGAYVRTHGRQTRSADEGETTFCECTKCGTKWRQS